MTAELPIRDGQVVALKRLLEDYGYTEESRLWIAGELVGHPVTRIEDLTLNEWRAIRDEAYPNWSKDDWKVSAKFCLRLAGLRNDWREKHDGQMKLF